MNKTTAFCYSVIQLSVMSYEVIPAILPKTFAELPDKLGRVRGLAQEVQIDIVDGKFALAKTWPYVGDAGEFAEILAEKRGLPFWDEFDFEFDLMVAKPQEVVSDWVRAGASRIILHIESAPAETLSEIIHEWKHAVSIGLALNPSTPLEALLTLAHEVSLIQCMGNDKIGFQGVSLDESVLPKIKALRAAYPVLPIAVDIGVNAETAPRLVASGATRLIAGSAIFGAPDPKVALQSLRVWYN